MQPLDAGKCNLALNMKENQSTEHMATVPEEVS